MHVFQAQDRRGHPGPGTLRSGAGGAAPERARLRPDCAPRGDAAAVAEPDAGRVPPLARRIGGGSRYEGDAASRAGRSRPCAGSRRSRASVRGPVSPIAARPKPGPGTPTKGRFCKTKPIQHKRLKRKPIGKPERNCLRAKPARQDVPREPGGAVTDRIGQRASARALCCAALAAAPTKGICTGSMAARAIAPAEPGARAPRRPSSRRRTTRGRRRRSRRPLPPSGRRWRPRS